MKKAFQAFWFICYRIEKQMLFNYNKMKGVVLIQVTYKENTKTQHIS